MTGDFVLLTVLALLSIIMYTIPTVIACEGDHPNRKKIVLINLFFGWTGIGWFFALFWSLKSREGNYFFFDHTHK
ncbi:MAG: superinfection immunity protein [Clostridiales bacterium]|nr:superinfection immunity protein [Clostridiales bacterium]